MAIPAAVDALLRKKHIAYGLATPVSQVDIVTGRTVRCAIVKHQEQRLQVLYPDDSLFDLDALHRATGQSWKALCGGALQSLYSRLGLQQAPALPGVLDVPVAVDESLLRAPELLLQSGNDELLRISGEAFRELLGEAISGPFSVSLATLEQGPCDWAADVADLTRAVGLFTPRRMKQRLEETLELPPLPSTAQRIIQLRVNPNADIRDLSDIVESDPSLAAQVVSWAASPYYAAPGRIRSVHDAIVRVLGFDLVLNLALGIALGRTLALPKEHVEGFTPYWQQAVFGAAAVEGLAGVIAPPHRPAIGLAYLGGLLHNFGYLLLAEVFPPQFSALCRLQAANPTVHHSYIERHLLGVTREQLAAWLMRLWYLPEPVTTALRYQHQPDYADTDDTYALVVLVAMRLLRQHGIGDASPQPVPASVYERLQLDPAAAANAIQNVVDASDELHRIATSLEG